MGCGTGVTVSIFINLNMIILFKNLQTYSENVAVVSVTRIASRFTMQIAAVMLILLSVFSKFAATLAAIPDPIVGGTFAIGWRVHFIHQRPLMMVIAGVCMICGVGFSNLKPVDLTKSRNLTIIGIALIFGNVSVQVELDVD